MENSTSRRREIPDASDVSAGDMRISLRRLEIFCLVIEYGSVTRAAEHLVIAQPAVSNQLRGLEEWLAVQLFVRKGNRLELTEAGRRAHDWAQEVLTRTREIRRELEGLAGGTAGAANLSASMAVGTYLLSPLLARIRSRQAAADLTLHIVQPQQALHDVEVGESDMAVLSWHGGKYPAHLHEEHLTDEPMVLCAARGGPPHADVIDPEGLAGLPHVAGPAQRPFQQSLDRQLSDLNAPLANNVMIRVGHAVAMKQAIVEHGWVAWLPRYSVAEDLASGALRAVDVEGVALFERISLYYRENKLFSPFQKMVAGEIRAVLSSRSS